MNKIILMCLSIVCFSGCIGGKTLDARTTGTVITSSNLVRQPSGIYKLELTPAKSRPQLLATPSVEANESPINPSAAGEMTPFEPTVSEAEIKLPPVKVLVKDLKSLSNKDNLLPVLVDSDGQKYSLVPVVNEEAPKIKVHWAKLIEFYLGALVFFLVFYLIIKMFMKKHK